MRNLLLLIVIVFLASSCTKVNSLSDNADVETFKITSFTDKVLIDQEQIRVENNLITIPLEFGRKYFPLTITAEVGFSSTTEDILGDINFKKLVFNDVYTEPSFYLISESGVPHLWSVRIKDKPNAEIYKFEIQSSSQPADSAVVIRKGEIRVTLPGKLTWPVTVTPRISKTPSAVYKDYTDGSTLTFTSYNDVKKITLVSDDGDEKYWDVRITPSIENSDFELWTGTGKLININPMPGIGFGWATANNTYVQGTQPISSPDGSKAALLSTSVQDLEFLGLGKLLAAGSIFTGQFKLNLQLDNPRSMTYFGIPFNTSPQSISLDAQYVAGKLLQQSVKEGNKYKLIDVKGSDKGHVWVELLHWAGEGELKYHKEKNIPGLIVLGKGEHVFNANDKDAETWKRRTIPIIYNNPSNLEPTHIAIVMTSSKEGDSFIGAVGSKLKVDNVTINY